MGCRSLIERLSVQRHTTVEAIDLVEGRQRYAVANDVSPVSEIIGEKRQEGHICRAIEPSPDHLNSEHNVRDRVQNIEALVSPGLTPWKIFTEVNREFDLYRAIGKEGNYC